MRLTLPVLKTISLFILLLNPHWCRIHICWPRTHGQGHTVNWVTMQIWLLQKASNWGLGPNQRDSREDHFWGTQYAVQNRSLQMNDSMYQALPHFLNKYLHYHSWDEDSLKRLLLGIRNQINSGWISKCLTQICPIYSTRAVSYLG